MCMYKDKISGKVNVIYLKRTKLCINVYPNFISRYLSSGLDLISCLMPSSFAVTSDLSDCVETFTVDLLSNVAVPVAVESHTVVPVVSDGGLLIIVAETEDGEGEAVPVDTTLASY